MFSNKSLIDKFSKLVLLIQISFLLLTSLSSVAKIPIGILATDC